MPRRRDGGAHVLALAAAIELAAACDIARALGHTGSDLDDAHRETGRAIALLGLFFHASVAQRRCSSGRTRTPGSRERSSISARADAR